MATVPAELGDARRWKRPSGTSRRRTCSRRSSNRLASAELLPGSNCLSQTNRVTPASAVSSSRCSRSRRKRGRDPLGDARFDPALRVHQRVGAEPFDRRRGRQDGLRVAAGLDEPAHQALVRLRLFRFVAEPLDELTRRAAREGPESVQTAQLGKMLVPRSRTAPRSRPSSSPSRLSWRPMKPTTTCSSSGSSTDSAGTSPRTWRLAAWACACSPARARRSTRERRAAAGLGQGVAGDGGGGGRRARRSPPDEPGASGAEGNPAGGSDFAAVQQALSLAFSGAGLIRSRCAQSRRPSPCPPSGRRASSSSATCARRSAARARGSPRSRGTP